jgi:hypothetical protein
MSFFLADGFANEEEWHSVLSKVSEQSLHINEYII